MFLASVIALWIAMAINLFGCWLSYRRVRYWRHAFRNLGLKHAALLELTSERAGQKITITVNDDESVTVIQRPKDAEMTVQ